MFVKNRFFIFIVISIFLMGFSFAAFGFDNENLPKVTREPPTVITFDNVTGSVNSSIWWNGMNAINTTQMENNGGVLNILVSWLESLIEGSFNSTAWNRSGTNVFLANIGDNVGIGTTSPDAALEIKSSSPFIKIRDTEDGTVGFLGDAQSLFSGGAVDNMGIRGESGIEFGTSTNIRMKIDSLGKIGINTTTPQNTLNVIGDINATGFYYGDGSQLTGISILSNSTSWNRSGTNVFLANTGDNVGIGTSTPQNTLNVLGDGNFTEDLYVGDATGDQLIVQAGSTSFPGFRFSNDVNTGLMSWGPNQFSVILNGNNVVRFNQNSLRVSPTGSAVTPVIGEDTANAGIFFPSGNIMGFSAGNTEFLRLEANVPIEAVFNDQSGDIDFRVETNNEDDIFFIEGSTDRVGINTTTPQNLLNVIGDANVTGDIYSNDYQVISYQRTVNIKNVTMTAVI